jgi:hypothetical protein
MKKNSKEEYFVNHRINLIKYRTTAEYEVTASGHQCSDHKFCGSFFL